jgi:hypothetical protein
MIATLPLPPRHADGSRPDTAPDIFGGPLLYLDHDNEPICPGCASGMADDELTGAYEHETGAPIPCDRCGARIDSQCGEPDPPSRRGSVPLWALGYPLAWIGGHS